MNVVLPAALAVQLALTAAAKWRTRRAGRTTLVTLLFPRAPAGLFVVMDLALAVGLMAPGTRRLSGGLVVVMTGLSLVAAIASRRGDVPCGCFGDPRQGQGAWRGPAAGVVVGLQGLVVALAPEGAVPLPAGLTIGVVLTGVVLALQPQLLRPEQDLPEQRLDDALRLVVDDAEFRSWQPYLLSESSNDVAVRENEVVLHFEAWRGADLVLLRASVSRGSVSVTALDGLTLLPLAT